MGSSLSSFPSPLKEEMHEVVGRWVPFFFFFSFFLFLVLRAGTGDGDNGTSGASFLFLSFPSAGAATDRGSVRLLFFSFLSFSSPFF